MWPAREAAPPGLNGVARVGLSLAELDRWDPDAIHGVFEAATARAEHTRTTASSVGDVVFAVPGSGQAFDAAQQVTGSIRTITQRGLASRITPCPLFRGNLMMRTPS